MSKLGATTSVMGVGALAACALVSSGGPTPAPATAAPAPYAIAWSQNVDVPGQPRLAAGESLVFLTSTDAGLAAYSQADGNKVWSTSLMSDLAPVAAGDMVAVLSAHELSVVEEQTGRLRWSAPIDQPPPQPTLQAVSGLLIASAGNAGQELRAWRLDGSEAWRSNLGGALLTPAASNGAALFVGVDSPAIVALDAATGVIRWRLPIQTQPTSLAATSDRLYFSGTDGALYSYRQSAKNGPSWRYQLLEAIGQPITDERHVYFTLIDNTVRALDRKGGSQRWSRELPSRAVTGPILAVADIVVPLTTGRLVQLSTGSGMIAEAAKQDRAAPRLRLQAVAATVEAATIYTMVIAGDDARTLTAWRRPPPK